MLILTRRPSETIHIGNNVTLTILSVKGNQIRIGIDAPREIAVVRGELLRGDEVSAHDPAKS